MKKIFSKSIIVSLVILLIETIMGTGAYAKNGEDIHQFHRISPSLAISEMGAGWNLGNTLDAIPTEGSWNNAPVQAKTFDAIKSSGFRSVRIPVTWTHHMGPAPDYTVDPKWMDRVAQVVDMALSRGFYVDLNVHHDSWEWADLSKGTAAQKQQKLDKLEKLWKQIADRFKNRSQKLMFESLNEPVGSDQTAAEENNKMNQSILKVIRSSGGHNKQRIVILPGLNTNIDKTIKWFKNPDPADKNLILTVHNYDPWGFVSNSYGITNWDDVGYFDKLFGKLNTFSKNIGMPVLIGEYGALSDAQLHSKWLYTDSFVRAAAKYHMATMLWDNGNQFNRVNGVWNDPILKDIIINASKSIPNSFIGKASLYVKDGDPITDQSMSLDLNGNQLLGVYNGNTKLSLGTDYTINTNSTALTLTKDYIKSAVHNHDLGVDTTLRFKFSAGSDQRLRIIQYKTPVLDKTDVTIKKGAVTDDLTIPTRFNGTTLATVTALEVDSNGNYIMSANQHPFPVKEQWTEWMPNTTTGGLQGGLNSGGDFWSDGSHVYISKNVLNAMTTDAVFSFKFWPRGKEVHVNVTVHITN